MFIRLPRRNIVGVSIPCYTVVGLSLPNKNFLCPMNILVCLPRMRNIPFVWLLKLVNQLEADILTWNEKYVFIGSQFKPGILLSRSHNVSLSNMFGCVSLTVLVTAESGWVYNSCSAVVSSQCWQARQHLVCWLVKRCVWACWLADFPCTGFCLWRCGTETGGEGTIHMCCEMVNMIIRSVLCHVTKNENLYWGKLWVGR